jgi:hypothetical protein
MQVTLSTGEQITIKDKFTHEASLILSNARNKGVVDKEYTDINEKGEEVVRMVRERPVVNYDEAGHAILLYMIEKVGDQPVTRQWLGELSEPDYELLYQAVVDIRKQSREAAAKGKKNIG